MEVRGGMAAAAHMPAAGGGAGGGHEDALDQIQAALRAAGRGHDAPAASVLSGASALRRAGGAFLPPAAAAAFKSACLGPLFARFAVQKGRAVALAPGAFDCGKLGRYHFQVDPASVASSNNHPFQDWLDRLRDFTGTHALSPAPLVPWPVYRGTLLHAVSCCLVGLEMYWQALALAVAAELGGDRLPRYLALLGRGDAAEELLERLVAVLQPESRVAWTGRVDAEAPPASPGAGGLDVFFHPVIAQALSNVLGRVLVVFDILSARQEKGGGGARGAGAGGGSEQRQGVFAPWHAAAALPPLCVAWEDAGRTRLVPLVPTRLPEASSCVLPDQLVPPVVFAHEVARAHGLDAHADSPWALVKLELLATDRQRRSQLLSRECKQMSEQFREQLLAVMSACFAHVTGLALQTVVDVRSLLLDLGVREVEMEELVCDAAEAAREGRLYYHGVSCQLTMRRGLYCSADLAAPNGRLYLAALRQQQQQQVCTPTRMCVVTV